MVQTLIESNCELILRDANLEDAGEVTKYTQWQCTLKLNDIGSWQLDLSTKDFQSYEIDETMGIMFLRDKELLLSGPVMSIENSLTSGQETTKIIGGTDELWLNSRFCYPVVTGPIWDIDIGSWVFNKKRSAVGIVTITTEDTPVTGLTVSATLTVESAAGFVVGNTAVVINTNGSMHPRTILDVDTQKNTIDLSSGDVVDWPAGCIVFQTSGGIIDDPSFKGYDTRRGPAENVAKELVYFNAGAGACADEYGSRAINYLTVAPTLGRGIPTTSNARGDNLLTQVQDVCASGGINFSVTQQGQQLVFDCSYGNDLATNSVLVFSVEGGNLREYDFTYSPPTANFVIGSGPSNGVDTLMLPSGDTDSIAQYGRIEKWISSSSSAAGATAVDIASNMVQTNNLDLAQDLLNSSIMLAIQENDQVRFPRDFQLGDTVGFQIGNFTGRHIISNINYSIPVASGGAGGSAITAAVTTQMTKSMQNDAAISKLLQQMMLQP